MCPQCGGRLSESDGQALCIGTPGEAVSCGWTNEEATAA